MNDGTISQPGWIVLLLGGSSGTGKTSAAEQISRRLGTSWLMVDDLRLALQRSRVTRSENGEALSFFQDRDVWRRPPARLRDGLIAVGELMSPAVEVVTENHVDTRIPVVIEGDGILPAVLARPPVRQRSTGGRIRAVFLVESDEAAILENMRARGGYFETLPRAEQRTQVRASWLYGQWLAAEAARFGLPVLPARPFPTLVERIVDTASQSSSR